MDKSDITPSPLSLAIDVDESNGIHDLILNIRPIGYSYLIVSILPSNSLNAKDENTGATLTRTEISTGTSEQNGLLVAKIVTPSSLASTDDLERSQAEANLCTQLDIVNNLSLRGSLLPLPIGKGSSSAAIVNIARIVTTQLRSPIKRPIWVRVPMRAPEAVAFWPKDLLGENAEFEAAWRAWSTFHSLTGFQKDASLALELTSELPPDAALARWLAEPISALLIPAGLFQQTADGKLALPPRHQAFLFSVLRNGASVVFTDLPKETLSKLQRDAATVVNQVNGPPVIESSAAPLDDALVSKLNQYADYALQVNALRPETSDPILKLLSAFDDYLVTPMQPLSEHLASSIYETFERDPIKYVLYERATAAALVDRLSSIKTKNPSFDNAATPLIVMVVGAGRGPIVRAVLRAANSSKVNVIVYALDKNPHAVNALEYAKRTEWADKPVRVVCADMRFWEPPENHRADIIVSELLGSFGDNELSPECLDGAQRFLADGGISIPTSYTSFLAPFQSAKLYSNVRDGPAKGLFEPLYYGDRSTWGLETAYSVKMQNHLVLAEQKELFTFKHPNPKVAASEKSAAKSVGEHNNRFEILSWTLTQECVIHGFAGYFDCVLYGDVIMSIHPKRHSPGLMTWGPILFPLRTPVRVTPMKTPGCGAGENGEVRVSFAMWRVCSEQKVWYEWALLEPQITEVHNQGGRSDAMSKIV